MPQALEALAVSRPHLRAASFAAVAVTVTSVAHTAGGGQVSAPLPLMLAACLGYGVHRFWIGTRDRSPSVLVVTLAGVQAVGHLLLSLTGPAAHQHHGAGHGGLLMLAWHALAAAGLGLLLQRNETALWLAARRYLWQSTWHAFLDRLTAWVGCRLTPSSPRPLGHRLGLLRLAVAEHLGLRRLLLETTGGRVRRGPPARPLSLHVTTA